MSNSTVNTAINERAALMKWANDTEMYLQRSITNKGLTETRTLRNSIDKQVIGLTTDVKTFVFKFRQYGMYVDMGLFGGKSKEETRDAELLRSVTGTRRRNRNGLKNRKKSEYMWFSRTMYGSIDVLGRELMRLYGNQAINAFRLPEIIEI